MGHLTVEVPHCDLVAAEGEEGLVLVEEDEGRGRAEVLVLHGDDAAREQVDDLERRVLLLEQQPPVGADHLDEAEQCGELCEPYRGILE